MLRRVRLSTYSTCQSTSSFGPVKPSKPALPRSWIGRSSKSFGKKATTRLRACASTNQWGVSERSSWDPRSTDFTYSRPQSSIRVARCANHDTSASSATTALSFGSITRCVRNLRLISSSDSGVLTIWEKGKTRRLHKVRSEAKRIALFLSDSLS
jgi:hypothetical protein